MLEDRLQLEYCVQFRAPNKRKISANRRQLKLEQFRGDHQGGGEAGALALGREDEGAGPGQSDDGVALGKPTCSPPYGEPSRKQSWAL